jgi:hypothetical protein
LGVEVAGAGEEEAADEGLRRMVVVGGGGRGWRRWRQGHRWENKNRRRKKIRVRRILFTPL